MATRNVSAGLLDDVRAIGDKVEFHGTIKSHDDYRGLPQTMVARCVLGPMKAKSKKSAKVVDNHPIAA